MARDSTSQALREIRALYALGPIGGTTDAQLLGRFLGRGDDAEGAFAALVERHGPMVLGVCRRMLGGDGAEDAFQATFLVLARRAGAIRRREGLKAWLYGVAVRTAKEARRRSARRREWEGRAMDISRAGSAPDEGRGEWLALLDEELQRLPERLRLPLVLCDLEGMTRQDASRRLGLPEGTLSSRIARGRSLLRDRLTRRGVALGAGALAPLLAEPAVAALPAALAGSTVRLAFSYTAGGAVAGSVPAAVASLADGVHAMISLAKPKLVLFASALVAAGLTVAWAAAPGIGDKPDAARPAAVADAKAADAVPADLRQAVVRGTVVDEAGRPVAGAEVRIDAFRSSEARGVSGPDGSFAIPSPRTEVGGTAVLARSGDRVGLFRYDFNPTRAQAEAPARVVLKPGRDVRVRVVRDDAPVLNAAVEAAGQFTILDHATTGVDGTARLSIPADARVEWVFAVRPDLGFDYAEFGAFDEAGRSRGGVPGREVPEAVDLRIGDARTVRIKAVDRDGKPLAGIGFSPWLLRKEGRKGQVNLSSPVFEAETGADGVATFAWLPPFKNLLQFWPREEGYAHRRVVVEEGASAPVVARMTRTETIRGRVVRPDGSPAAGMVVEANGSGQGMDHGRGRARTGADGSYEMQVAAGEAYVAYVSDEEWTAPTRVDVVVLEGKPVIGVDFALTRGTIVRGTVTIGPAGRPAPGEQLRLVQDGGKTPEDLREPGDRLWHQAQRTIWATTDAEGRYSARVAPGRYQLIGPLRTEPEEITVANEPEVVRDFRMPRPEKGPLSGRVVFADAKDRGVPGAKVEYTSASFMAVPTAVTADADGRFRCERYLDKTTLHARTPDGKLAAIVEIGQDDPEVVLPLAPTATATGLLLDESGKPLANQKLFWGRKVHVGEEGNSPHMHLFAPKVTTDAEGRFTLPGLVVGQRYEIMVDRGGVYPGVSAFRPRKPGPLDLGTLREGHGLPADPDDPADRARLAEENSSFRKDAPGPGSVAPPISATTLDGKPLSLDDFRGKYVLLDFWATWCGPCLGEIPNLQAVHDAFGKDGRFAILSLSVDEKVGEPKAFQEKRKLPWNQGFLGGGIHGDQPGKFGVRAIPAFVLVGPDGKIVARGMRGDEIKKAVAEALGKTP